MDKQLVDIEKLITTFIKCLGMEGLLSEIIVF